MLKTGTLVEALSRTTIEMRAAEPAPAAILKAEILAEILSMIAATAMTAAEPGLAAMLKTILLAEMPSKVAASSATAIESALLAAM